MQTWSSKSQVALDCIHNTCSSYKPSSVTSNNRKEDTRAQDVEPTNTDKLDFTLTQR